MAVTLTGLTPAIIDRRGGQQMEATGTFPLATNLLVFLGPLGTEADEPCFGGLGNGYAVRSTNGTTIAFYAPPLARGTHKLTVREGVVNTVLLAALTVVERSWHAKAYSVRTCLPPILSTGARNVALEPREDT